MVDFPAPKYCDTNGIRMAYYEAGEKSDKPPVILCHGFPEIAYSWRHQLPALAAAGFHAIAPDMRGYGKTDQPDAITDYDMQHLMGDLVGLMDHLGYDKAIFCGHDWGGFVVWQMPLYHADRVAGVIGVNTPFMPRSPMDPIELMRMAMGEDMYIVAFQEPGKADAILNADPGKALRFFYRKSALTLKEFEALPQDQQSLAMLVALQESPESEWTGSPLLTEEEYQVYLEAFESKGFTGGINWYRNFTRNWEMSEGVTDHVPMPSLMISAEDDIALRPQMADGMEQFVPDLEKHLIPACGHWTQSEKPDELNALMMDWLGRRFA
ncbi:MAG: alpha/beta fold hydrolase [Alphaproteobacteria bacterium]